MKTVRFISILSVAAIFVSCAKEETSVIEKPQVSVISASIEQPTEEGATKTALGTFETGKGYPINWSAGDAIAISGQDGTSASQYVLEPGQEGGTFGIFTGESLTGSAYAYYPYSQVTKVDGATYSVNIPVRQAYVDESTFANGAMPMCASTADIAYGLNFKPLMSVLKLQLTGSGVSVSKIFVSAADHSTILSGRATVNMSDGTMTFGEGFDYVELDCAEPVALSGTETIFHIVVPANTTAADYRVKIVASDGQVMNKELTNRTFAKQMIKKMSPLSFAGSSDFPYTEGSYSGTGVNIAGIICAPVNCGYLSSVDDTLGLLYQWGRKYGQNATKKMTGTDFITIWASSMAEGSNVANKDKFYRGNYYWYDGYSADDRWWSNYDPCPAGWRVPTKGELTVLKGKYTSRGKFIDGSNTVEFTFAGCRDYLGDVSDTTDGEYWSSDIDANTPYMAWCIRLYVNTKYIESRNIPYGLSVRCVQE